MARGQKGNYKEGSDIDLTLNGYNLTLPILNKINMKLDDLSLPYIIDLSVHSNIQDNDLIAHIQHVGQILYKK